MTTLRTVSFAVGLTLAATRVWAQALHGPDLVLQPMTMPEGIQPSTTVPGLPELTPDQKLARAFALCDRTPAAQETIDCRDVRDAWLTLGHDWDADRAFIEEVARSLK